jgi:Ser/Thr protein kinase RdoA (MazF antagonist)
VAFVDHPVPDLVTLGDVWSVDLAGEPVRLHGGEESAAYRVGDHVVRVGPTRRSIESIEWCHRVATVAARAVPEVVAPIPTTGGATVVRIGDFDVSVWPFVDATWADDEDDGQFEQAAALLARLHRALAEASTELVAPPPQAVALADAPELDDPALDEWLRELHARASVVHAQHGDWYRGNLLARGGRIVAIVDWNDAFAGPPVVGLANGAWEWGDGLWADDLDDVFEFVDLYVAAGGTAPGLTEEELRHLVRARLRWEIRYSRLHNPDPEYEARQLLVFERLRVPSRP